MIARVFFAFFLVASTLAAATHDLVLVGSGGEPEYEQRFADWQQRLEQVLAAKMGHAQDRLHVVAGPDSLRAIERVVARLQNELKADDVLFVWLIGHGSYRNSVAKLNIPGPDLSAEKLGALLNSLATERVVLLHTASVSAAFISVLSAEGRVICTSTRSPEERNAPLFMEYILSALEGESADQDRDGRVSVLELCGQAAVLTQASYDDKGLLATEHALVDDNGDGLGVRLSAREDGTFVGAFTSLGEAGRDGVLAASVFVKDMQYPAGASAALVRQYEQVLAAVEALITQKGTLDEDVYYRRLETLFLDVARVAAQIWPAGSAAIDD